MRLTIFMVALLCSLPDLSDATVIFTTESGYTYSDGVGLPNPPFCWTECGAGTGTGQTRGVAALSTGCDQATSAPTGTYCHKWNVVANQADHYNEIGPSGGINHVVAEGDVIYLAWQENYTRIGSVDIWAEGVTTQSGDKGVGIRGGDLADFRWDVSHGQWDSMCPNTDHKWTVWVGNPSNHFNPSIEVGDAIRPNVSPYGVECSTGITDGPQLDYDRWYNMVMEIKFADASPQNGYVRVYVNGTKVVEYLNIQTADTFAGSNITIGIIEFGGTMCQPSYNCPAHTRYFDNFVVADSSADVSGFMSDPEAGGGAPPTLLLIRTLGGVATGLQALFCLSYFWERRSVAVRAAMQTWRYVLSLPSPKDLYWIYKYKRAVKRWQKAAPVMLEGPHTISLTAHGGVWGLERRQ